MGDDLHQRIADLEHEIERLREIVAVLTGKPEDEPIADWVRGVERHLEAAIGPPVLT